MKNKELYAVIDIQKGFTVALRSTRKAASKWADKKDLEYGAIRHVVKCVIQKESEVA